MALSSLIGQGFVLVSGVIVARSFDPADRGTLAIFAAVPIAVSSVLLLGLPSALVYFSSIDRTAPWLAARWFRQLVLALALGAALASMAMLFGVIESNRLPGSSVEFAALVGIVGAGLVVQGLIYALMQGRNRFVSVAVARLLPSLVYALTVVAMFIAGRRELVEFAAAWVLSNLVVIAFYLRPRLLRTATQPPPDAAAMPPERRPREVIGYGLRSHIGTLSPLDNLRVDQLIASIWMPPVALGLYVVAQSFSSAPKILANNLGYAVHADSSRDASGTTATRRSRLKSVLRLCAALFAVCTLMAALMPLLLPWLFGSVYASAVTASQLLIFAAALAACRRLIGEYAKGMGSPILLSIAEFVVAPVLGLMMLIVPASTALVGFSICVLLAQSLVTAGMAVAFSRSRHV